MAYVMYYMDCVTFELCATYMDYTIRITLYALYGLCYVLYGLYCIWTMHYIDYVMYYMDCTIFELCTI